MEMNGILEFNGKKAFEDSVKNFLSFFDKKMILKERINILKCKKWLFRTLLNKVPIKIL
jgi:hypothetical protein